MNHRTKVRYSCFILLALFLLTSHTNAAAASKERPAPPPPIAVSPLATFIVNTAADTDDGACTVNLCSLRDAINAANASASAAAITFNIPGSGVQTIQVNSTNLGWLPDITVPITIDGYTQPGASANTLASGDNAVLLIELAGPGFSGFSHGLELSGGNSLVRGLVIDNFDVGIRIDLQGGDTVAGNFIGTDASGSLSHANNFGLQIFSGANLIGGASPEARNVISGNNGGIDLSSGDGNVVEGNFIGADASGKVAVGNSSSGVSISTSNNIIGGMSRSARNIISGNGFGLFFDAGAPTNNVVEGNFIGTDVSGALALSNATFGVFIAYGSGNTIGGTVPGAGNVISANARCGVSVGTIYTSGNLVEGNFIGTGLNGVGNLGNGWDGVCIRGGTSHNLVSGNVIAHNQQAGVAIGFNLADTAASNATRQNSIFGNTKLGIDLGSNGVTANHTGCNATGPNNLQNFPVVTSAVSATRKISGSLHCKPRRTYRLEFFSNGACDRSGYGEGQIYLGYKYVTTGSAGGASFSVQVPVAFAVRQLITATATDSIGNTSEFSKCRMAS
jgi:CSLREA domain-containing protein